ncbi:sigma-70 family RNA polymerase sigma factor [Bremerella cremea]|uniref:sigma-70 family RNA polymerase sigma factor n=1 Tax=Bremerella cremea TaxID=1031537 RepID=UPI0031E993AE
MDDDKRKAWAAYFADPSDDHRNQVLVLYLDLAQRLARRMARRLPHLVELEADLVTVGMQRLLLALPRYDPGRESFEQFATCRLRGAFLDHLRDLDPLSQESRSRVKQRSSLVDELRQASRGQACQADIEDALTDELRNVAELRLISLDDPVPGAWGDTYADLLTDRPADSDTGAGVAEMVRTVDFRSAMAVWLRFVSGLDLKQIGTLLGVSESRACQLIAHALQLARDRYSANRQPP